MEHFKISINNIECTAHENETILQVAGRHKIDIPALCYHCDLIPHESCRLCMVSVEGEKGLKAACSYKVQPDIRVLTDTEEIKQVLRINLELLFAQHRDKCEECHKKDDCKLRYLAQELVFENRFNNRKDGKLKYQFGLSIVFDPEKCINCEDCSEMCAKQTNGGFLRPREGKYNFEVNPSREKSHDCIYCGQCVVHCPVGALTEVEDYQKVRSLLVDKSQKVIFQFAPAIRVALGEEFGLEPGTNVTDQMYSAFKKIGAFKAFDTCFGADVTVMEEAEELVERIVKNEPGAMFSSCCPAWVKYLEFYEKQFIPNLTSVRSPQIILGGLIKTYWAKKQKIHSNDITVVSIMPCTAKKFEVTRKELFIEGRPPVDYSLTTREFAKLLKSFDVDLARLEPDLSDKDIMATTTGAAEIFGASGGVLEAALRTAYYKITGTNLKVLEFEPLHQSKAIKVAEVEIAGKKIKAVAVSGMENVKKILAELKENPQAYNYVEVMACPGGCIGGGGQPLPINDEIRKKRAHGLYQSDRDRKIRVSHQNPGIKTIYDEFLKIKANAAKTCHTTYKLKKKGRLITRP